MPKLVFHDSDGIDKTIEIGADPIMIGRANECQVQTQDAMVSRRHARIFWDGGYFIEDLGSSNGVYIANERVQRAPVRPGDEVRCGSLTLKLLPDVPARGATGRHAAVRSQQQPPPQQPAYGAPPAYQPPAQQYGAAPGGFPMPPVSSGPFASMAAPPGAAPIVQFPPMGQMPPPASPMMGGADPMAVTAAEQRAATAEAKLNDAVERAREADQRATEAEQKLAQYETAARESEKWRRKVEQLTSEIRRLRGGAPPSAEDATDAQGVPSQAIAELTAERDALKAQVTQLNVQLQQAIAAAQNAAPGGGGGGDGDSLMLRRKVEQLTAELRRLRAGQPGGGAPPGDDPRVADLEARLAKAEQDRDAAQKQAAELAARPPVQVAPTPKPGQAGGGQELQQAKRLVDQLKAENQRLRAAASGAPPPAEDPRVAPMQAQIAQLEQQLAQRGGGGGGIDPHAAEIAGQINDLLGELRGNLRAANDEVGVLGVEAPGDSVTVLRDALTAGNEQLEQARDHLRELKQMLGVQ